MLRSVPSTQMAARPPGGGAPTSREAADLKPSDDQELVAALARNAPDLMEIPAERRLNAKWSGFIDTQLADELDEVVRAKAWVNVCSAMPGDEWRQHHFGRGRTVSQCSGCA